MPRILIAEGDEGVRRMLADSLPAFLPKAKLVFVKTGSNALQLFQKSGQRLFDLVLTGVVMPDISGVELTDTLKKRCPKLPVIIMSGSPEPPNHKANVFVSKPFCVTGICEIINRLLKYKSVGSTSQCGPT